MMNGRILMKVIISHDVDHLYWSDHLKDLIFPKLWVRETLAVLKRSIPVKDYFYRMGRTFQHQQHNLDSVMALDKQYGVPSTFFFGMANGLGMSYSKRKASSAIKRLIDSGFDVGVHGIAYQDIDSMKKEYEEFFAISNLDTFGIRMHYVRFDETTFEKLAKVGYIFDTSEFDKENRYLIKSPYKVNNTMWEFPLTIMDGYLPYKFDDAQDKTKMIITEAIRLNQKYISILFHDYLYSKGYAESKRWYEWVLKYCKQNSLGFISYRDAIDELEQANE